MYFKFIIKYIISEKRLTLFILSKIFWIKLIIFILRKNNKRKLEGKMKYLVKSMRKVYLNYSCTAFGGSSACDPKCGEKCYLCSCKSELGHCTREVLV